MSAACLRMYVAGGWLPVVGEDGAIPAQETEWKCSNSLSCLNLGWFFFPSPSCGLSDNLSPFPFRRENDLGSLPRLF